MTITRTPERIRFLSDLLTTAVEGGINYWCQVAEYRIWANPDAPSGELVERDDPYAVVVDYDGDEHRIDLDVIARGINRITDGKVTYYNHGYQNTDRRMASLNRSNGQDDDLGDYDAWDADAVVQAGLFGELIYG